VFEKTSIFSLFCHTSLCVVYQLDLNYFIIEGDIVAGIATLLLQLQLLTCWS
jgi:hypothetical protein